MYQFLMGSWRPIIKLTHVLNEEYVIFWQKNNNNKH